MRKKPFGVQNPKDWLDEGDGLLESAQIVRRSWRRRRRSFSKTIEGRRATASVWHALTGMPRSSMLLIGYAAEMFLKAGLCKALKNCDEIVFDRAVRRFGHDLTSLAHEIAISLSNEDLSHLEQLATLIVDARYPIVAEDLVSYTKAKNKQTHLIWSDQEFAAIKNLVAKIRKHVALIDADSRNPSSLRRVRLDSSSYIAFRAGGHLPTRLSIRYENGELGIDQIKDLIFSDPALAEIQIWWQRAFVYIVDHKGGAKLIREPLDS